jgi:hypothetical protein
MSVDRSAVTLMSRAPEKARSQKVFNSALILRAVVSAAAAANKEVWPIINRDLIF